MEKKKENVPESWTTGYYETLTQITNIIIIQIIQIIVIFFYWSGQFVISSRAGTYSVMFAHKTSLCFLSQVQFEQGEEAGTHRHGHPCRCLYVSMHEQVAPYGRCMHMHTQQHVFTGTWVCAHRLNGYQISHHGGISLLWFIYFIYLFFWLFENRLTLNLWSFCLSILSIICIHRYT